MPNHAMESSNALEVRVPVKLLTPQDARLKWGNWGRGILKKSSKSICIFSEGNWDVGSMRGGVLKMVIWISSIFAPAKWFHIICTQNIISFFFI